MNLWQAIVVGVVQGLAEFLPISSSGHIVLTQFLLGIKQGGEDSILFEVVLHVGTLLSVLVYFRGQLWRMTESLWKKEYQEERSWIWMLGLATVPAVILVLTPLGDLFESAYANPVVVSGLLLVTGALLLAPKVIKAKKKELTWKTALIMGVGQAFAILPGISRSGSTITAGLLSGVEAKKVAEFAFLMSIPAIAGAVVKEREAFASLSGELILPYVLGALAAFVSGLFAVYLVLAAIRKGRFEWFAYYCFAAGVLGLVWFGMVSTGWKA
ncbi:MAG: undecaprenyl-diphosphate phosphatase [Verrucomicrobiota bacterium JB023]|nr:undecaprenyl-diphosphate phosphatase [Verrucomicrobiota bacterium JB023]